MNRRKYSAQLGDLRVTDELHEKLLQVCEAQGMSLAEVRRAALAEYVHLSGSSPYPVVGQIVPDGEQGGKIVLFSDRFGLSKSGETYLEELNNEPA